MAVAIENKRLFNQRVEQESLRRDMELAGQMQRMLIPDNLPKGVVLNWRVSINHTLVLVAIISILFNWRNAALPFV